MTIEEEYREERQPDKKQRYENWTTAKGLQAVDGLVTSPYLDRIAREHIEGRYDSYRAKELIDSYYQTIASAEEINEHAEADMVAARINILIGERAFSLTTEELLSIQEMIALLIVPIVVPLILMMRTEGLALLSCSSHSAEI